VRTLWTIDERTQQSISAVAAAYLEDYKVRHRAGTLAEHALGHVTRLLGDKLVVDIK